jgi:hypothetical protein
MPLQVASLRKVVGQRSQRSDAMGARRTGQGAGAV